MRQQRIALFILLVLSVCFALIVTIPIDKFKILFDNLSALEFNEYAKTFLRTFIFSVVSSFLNIFISLSLAIIISFKYNKRLILIASLLFILPFTLGEATVSFIYKIIYINVFSERLPSWISFQIVYYVLMQIIQYWQLGFLWLYLILLQFINDNNSGKEYFIVHKLSYLDYLKSILIPKTKNLLVLLFGINFLFTFFESNKSNLIFKSSQGLNIELINSWFFRIYRSSVITEPNWAEAKIFFYGVITVTVLLILLFITLFLLNKCLEYFVIKKGRLIVGTKEMRENVVSSSVSPLLYILLFLIVVPILIACLGLELEKMQFSSELLLSLVLSCIACILVTMFSITISFVLRIVWQNIFYDLNRLSLVSVLGILSILLLPSIVIIIAGYKWGALVGLNNELLVYVNWIIQHLFLSIPLFTVFVIFIHFGTSNNELNFLSIHQLYEWDIFFLNFIKKYKLIYFFTFLVSFSFVWNEGIINKVFSDKIPALAEKVEMFSDGRSANYSSAFSFVIISFLISFIIIFIWSRIISNEGKNRPA